MGSKESKPSKDSGIQLVDLSKCGLHVANENDISEQDYRDTGKQLLSAFSTLGVARLSNHGIPWSEVDCLNKIADEFYKLPEKDKERFDKGGATFDVRLYRGSKTDSYGTTNTDLRNVQARFNETYFDFELKAGRLLLRLLKALGFGLKLKDKEFFVKLHPLTNKKAWLTAVIYFPNPTGDHRSKREIMLKPHVDSSSLVLIFQDSVGGLQVKNKSGQFIDVEPIPDTIIVNVGSTLESWTRNKVKGVVHRVCTPEDSNKRNRIRRSLVYSCRPTEFRETNMKLEFENKRRLL